jgi:hypothetical protein
MHGDRARPPGCAQDTAGFAAFVASPLAGHINGASVRIDGGGAAVA